MKLPFKLKIAQYGPYGNGWFGFKIDRGYSANAEYGYFSRLTVSLGRRWGWDGYQNTWVNRIYGVTLYHGKPIVEINEPEQDDYSL